jgi:hypothetical protein
MCELSAARTTMALNFKAPGVCLQRHGVAAKTDVAIDTHMTK